MTAKWYDDFKESFTAESLLKAYGDGRRDFSHCRVNPTVRDGRADRREGIIDLRGQDLRGIDLSESFLGYEGVWYPDGVTPKEVTIALLDGANLTGANLRNASLDHASMRGTILTRVDLTGTCLRESDLTDAVLRDANLRDTELAKKLAGADLAGTRFEFPRNGRQIHVLDRVEWATDEKPFDPDNFKGSTIKIGSQVTDLAETLAAFTELAAAGKEGPIIDIYKAAVAHRAEVAQHAADIMNRGR